MAGALINPTVETGEVALPATLPLLGLALLGFGSLRSRFSRKA